MALKIPPALYDYILYYECAAGDWIDLNQKANIKGDGSLMNYINWNASPTTVKGDSGGPTLFGVTHKTWRNYATKHGLNPNLSGMGKSGWIKIMEYFWSDYSHADLCANYACAMALFQMAWGGFSKSSDLLATLRSNKDKNYNFQNYSSTYAKISDTTNAYTDPMKAYDIIRKAKSTYLYNISTPDKANSKFRVGWLRRNVLAFTPIGLFVDTKGNLYTEEGLSYNSTLQDWENAAIRMANANTPGYRCIFNWGATPEQIAAMAANAGIYSPSDGMMAGYGGGAAGGSYGGCGGVHQLGNYTNSPDMVITPQQTQSREEVLNTLVGGSYTPDEIKKCSELITSDKKKNVKTKSEK